MSTWLTDRSRIQAYHDCRRLRYLNYHWEATGLERDALSLPLIDGSLVHGVLAGLLTGVDTLPEQVAAYRDAVAARGIFGEADTEFLVNEQLTLLEGLTRAWAKVRLPAILDEYTVVSVEQEMAWPMTDEITDMVRCDALVRRKRDGLLFILEFKTVSSATDDWARQWQHNSQLLANTRAVEEVYHEPVGGVLIEGLIKSRRAVDKGTTSAFHGRTIQQSPLCYGYRVATKTGDVLYETSWSRGAEKVAIWTEIAPADWIDQHLTIEELADLFISLPPFLPIQREQLRWKRQTIAQEQRIAADLQFVRLLRTPEERDEWLDRLFPQNDNHCFRYFGHPCQFEPLCFTEQIEQDPLNSGYRRRTPHHALETR